MRVFRFNYRGLRLIQRAIVGLFLIISVGGVGLWGDIQTYEQGPYHINYETPRDWSSVTPSLRRVIVSLESHALAASINVSTYRDTIPVTANGLQQRYMTGVYDGWINLGEEVGTSHDLKRANADEAYKAIYAKTQLNDDLSSTRVIAVEYYFTKGLVGYVLTFKAPATNLSALKPVMKKFLKQFWIGGGEQPKSVAGIPINFNWAMVSKNGLNQRQIPALSKFMFNAGVRWERMPTVNQIKRFPLFTGILTNRLIVAHGQSLQSIDAITGESHWRVETPAELVGGIAMDQDLLFYLSQGKTVDVYGILAESGQVVMKRSLSKVTSPSAPIIVNQRLFLNLGNRLEVLDGGTLDTQWTHSAQLNTDIYPVVSGETVFVVDSRDKLLALDWSNQSVRWTASLPYPMVCPGMVFDDQFIVLTQSNSTTLVATSYSLETGDELWSVDQSFKGIVDVSRPALATHYYGVKVRDNHSAESLWVVDVNTGKMVMTMALDKSEYLPSQTLIGSGQSFIYLTAQLESEFDQGSVMVHAFNVDTSTVMTHTLMPFEPWEPMPIDRFFLYGQGERLLMTLRSKGMGMRAF